MKNILFALLVVGISITTYSCTKDEVTEGGGVSSDCATQNNYTQEVDNIIQTKCAVCHSDGGTPPRLNTCAEVVEKWERVKARAVTDKTMPPSGALPSNEIQVLDDWIKTLE